MGVPDNRPIGVGRIDYTNAWPLFHYVPEETEDYRIVRRVPSGLNRMLQEGELAVSAVSSFIYGMDPQSYALLPGLSVGTVGPVRSILLFLKKPLREALRGRIALTDTSATSINLLKMILALRYDGNPDYTVMQPDLRAMLQDNDAALLIGDSAIRASWEEHGLEVMDLGEEWHRWTGLGMTYAVVAARRDALASRPAEVLHLHRDLLESRRRSVADPEPLVERATASVGGKAAYWREYFGALRYDFGPELREGLELYYRYAHQLGLIGEPASLAFMDPQLSTGR
ncbi:menaquinone biosynthesis protein [Paenibacillus albicereus]|uniref:Chorismate dehydratase n=1 Tax=Paenibacillus albicereus TaxID=2726185 RepID=A0A6H2H4N8_9BACL|nr:menaquinone biosynthesis protein [Paenibacillus albicereus]QJC54308.1 menaquinone biosynthesis protein [Paenibacillus albicereus]